MNIENEILPQGPLNQKQYSFLNRFDKVISWITVLLVATILFAIPFGALDYGTYYGDELNVYIAVAAIAGLLAMAIGCAFFFIATKRLQQGESARQRSLPFTRSLKSLAIIWVLLIVWACIYLLDDHFFVNILLYAPLALFLGLLFGAIAWAVVAAPVAILVRVVHQTTVKKDAALLVPATLAVGIITFASLIIIGPIAIDTELSTKAGAAQSMYALLGVPGDYYTIENEIAFAIGRYVLYASIALFVTFIILKRHFSRKAKASKG